MTPHSIVSLVMDQPKAESLLPSHPKRPSLWTLLLFPVSQLCTLGLLFYSFSHSDWLHYCWFRFGLLNSSNIRLNSSTISVQVDRLRRLFCSGNEFNVSAEMYCPGFCGHMTEMERAGGIMLFFMIVAVAGAVGALVQHVIKWKLREFYTRYFLLFAVIPFVSLFIGAIVYVSLMNYSGFSSVSTSSSLCESDRPVDMTLQSGSMFALITLVAQLGTTLCGVLISAKHFRKPTSV